MATTSNPFDIAYEGLQSALFKVPALRAAIPEGNRIAFSDVNSNPVKPTVIDSDLPELMIFQTSYSGNLHINADSCKITLNYSLQIATGVYDSRKVNSIMLGCLAALLNWKNTLHTLRYEGYPFIKDVRINPTPLGLSNAEANRKIPGWAAILGIELDLYIQTQLILASLNVEAI